MVSLIFALILITAPSLLVMAAFVGEYTTKRYLLSAIFLMFTQWSPFSERNWLKLTLRAPELSFNISVP